MTDLPPAEYSPYQQPYDDGKPSEKSWIATALLGAFLGSFGADRFYLGHTKLGVFKLITCGGCGIWALVDLIITLTGSMRDARGRKVRWSSGKELGIGLGVVIALIVVGGIVGVTAGASSTNDGNQINVDTSGTPSETAPSTEKKSSTAPQEGTSTEDLGTDKNPAPLGVAIKNKSASYKILSVKTADEIGPAGFGATAAGKFVVITLAVKNVKDESIQISSSDFTLQVGGNEIDVSDDSIYLDDSLTFEDLSPGLTKTGTVAFDVAPADAGAGVLTAQAMLSLDEKVYLSLTK